MNLQDVASLTIPEGGVRNIRDGNGNLLWSSVGYNVRYDGDSYQQTYSGANLFNYTDTSNVGSVTTVSDDGFIAQSKDNSSGTGSVFNNYYTHNLALDTSTTYAIVVEVQAVSGAGSLVPVSNHSSAQSTNQLEYLFSDLHAGDIIVGQFKTKSSFSGDNGIRSYTRYGAGESGSITYRISVLANTSVTPETFVYQPYTGGIPAPNPDYPQPIQVVTGAQTVTVSDGVDSEDYTISLGSLELCKIGTYQDYIYKSGDDWYVHKATGKVVLNGSEHWTQTSSGVPYTDSITGYALSGNTPISNYFIGEINKNTAADLPANHVGFNAVTSAIRFWVKYPDRWTTGSAVADWLSTHNSSVYYAVATPTDTQITDATLVGQLDAIHNWLIRHDYSGTVSGNLPIIINRTGLT